MTRIVSVIGTDGSGKTTLCAELALLFRHDGIDAGHEWLGAESLLMAPVRSVLRHVWRRPGIQRVANGRAPAPAASAYASEIEAKNRLATRVGWARSVYIWLVLLDYRLQVAVKLWRARRRDVLVADRYMFDVVVNLALTLGWHPQETVAFAQKCLRYFQLPQVRVFLRVEPEVSIQRKDDIPEIAYLRLRFVHYEALAEAFGFVTLDGTDPIPANADRLRHMSEVEFAKPYVHYVHSNNSDVGGADLVLVSMAHHARHPAFADDSGFRASVSLRLATEVAERHASNGTPVILGRYIRPQTSRGPLGVARMLAAAPSSVLYFLRLFRREDPDLVHVNDLYDFLPAIAARLARIPVVYHLRMIKTGTVQRGFSRMLPRVSSVTVSVSNAVRDHYFPPPANRKHVVIRDLGNPRLVENAPSPTRPVPRLEHVGRLVVMVGRIERWKGQHIFLDAVARLDRTVRMDNTFALVGGRVSGSEGYFADVANQSRALSVHMLGQRNDVVDLLWDADVSVHCSIDPDPFPGVVVESLLAGTATVAAAAGGVPEILDNPAVGVLYKPGDSVELALVLNDLLTSKSPPRETYGSGGRARALSLVDPATVDRAVFDVYEALIPGRRGSATLADSTHSPPSQGPAS